MVGAKSCHSKCVGRRGADRDPVDQERAGVVEQAFAFEDFQDPIGQLDLPQNGRRRRGVRRRDDGAERDRGRPRHVRHQPADQERHRGGGQADRDKHQGGDRQPIVAKVAQRGVEGGIEQHRRYEQRQREVRLQRPGRPERHEGQQHAAKCKECRIGHLGAAGRGRQQHRAEQQGNDPFKCRQPECSAIGDCNLASNIAAFVISPDLVKPSRGRPHSAAVAAAL